MSCRQSKKQTRSNGPSKGRGRRDLEVDPVGQPGVRGTLTRRVDRTLVRIEADDARRWVRLGKEQRRRTVPAADVGDVCAGGELGLDTIERGDPGTGKVVEVAGPEEPFAAAEDVPVMVAPREPVAGPESLRDGVRGVDRSEGDLEGADDARRAGLIGERDGVLVGQQ